MTKITRTLVSALTVVAALFAGSMAASAAETVTEGFDTFSTSWQGTTKVLTLPEGWDFSGNANDFSRDDERFKTKKPSILVEGAHTADYLITPELTGQFSFYLRNRTKNYLASVTAYACTYADGVLTLGSQIGTKTLSKTTSGTPSWEQVSFTTTNDTRVALLLSNANFDDFTYTLAEATASPELTVLDYVSGGTFDFGKVAAGTEQSFTLKNNGMSELTISSISVTGGYTITAGATLTAIAPRETATVTIATPAQDGEGVLTIASNDANSPYLLNIKSTYKVPAPVMEIDKTVLDFGTVTADITGTITVSNTGDAELTATIASDNSEFTVSTSSITVQAGESVSFDVTFHYAAEAYGGHAANITIQATDGDTKTVKAMASITDPNQWTEDFSSNTLPEGWDVVGTSWTFSDGEAQGSYEPGGWIVTPRLKVQTGQAMTFQARSRQYNTDVKVEYQKDGGEWTSLFNENRNTQTNFETYTVSGLEAGTYRFRVASENLNLDNFEGFTLAPSTAVKETWHISYTFHYNDEDGEHAEEGTENMEVEFDGDKVGFYFPNPMNGNAWLRGTRYEQEGIVYYIFPMGQYIGKYSGENIYYCGGANDTLTDIQFFYSDDDKAFYCFEHVLLNGSTTAISLWGYFSDVIIYKDQKPAPTGISDVRQEKADTKDCLYNISGQQVDSSYRGIVIRNGKKYMQK